VTTPPAPDDRHAAVTAVVADHPAVRLAVLYGSVAQGAAGPESDLDLAVMGERPLSAGETVALVRALAHATGRPVDLVDLRTVHGALLAEVLRTGTRLYEADPTVYPSVLRRHLFDEADFRPYRDRILAERRRAWTDA
jgi:predicted nucleotidyltransferase